jgi:predicted HNH restriction endonuclease
MLMALRNPFSASGRVYESVELTHEETGERAGDDLQLLRTRALNFSSTTPAIRVSEVNVRERKNIIKLYALARSGGICDACEEPAPFIRKNNGEPYLEVHHIIELSMGGSDSPHNVAAVCPNCHARVTYGEDATSYNGLLSAKIKLLEDRLTSS